MSDKKDIEGISTAVQPIPEYAGSGEGVGEKAVAGDDEFGASHLLYSDLHPRLKLPRCIR
jgi:hypothetical protein